MFRRQLKAGHAMTVYCISRFINYTGLRNPPCWTPIELAACSSASSDTVRPGTVSIGTVSPGTVSPGTVSTDIVSSGTAGSDTVKSDTVNPDTVGCLASDTAG